jgi:hypothetical protein
MALRSLRRAIPMALLGSGLAACGGSTDGPSDGGSSGDLPLATKADVLREIGTLSSAASFFTDTLDEDAILATAKSLRGGVRQGETLRLKATTENCEAGGTSSVDSGSKSYDFDFFGRTTTVEFERYTDSDCRFTETFQGGSTRYTYDGVDETGETLAGAVPVLEYRAAGSGNGPVSFEERTSYSNNTVDTYTSTYLGDMQKRTENGVTSYASALVFSYRSDENGSRYDVDATMGFDGAPFRASLNANGALTLDGSLRYGTSECDGGELAIATTALITQADGGYVNGGTVRLSSGTASVTVTFNSDGSASYQFQSGGGGTLTRAEVEAAIQDGSC